MESALSYRAETAVKQVGRTDLDGALGQVESPEAVHRTQSIIRRTSGHIVSADSQTSLMSAPLLIMLAGPDGAGKSTFYESHLQTLELRFLNADILARAANMDDYTAADTIAAIRDQRIAAGLSFVTETVFSDPVGEKVRVLVQAARRGFEVTLIYIGLKDPKLSRRRVEALVKAGGTMRRWKNSRPATYDPSTISNARSSDCPASAFTTTAP